MNSPEPTVSVAFPVSHALDWTKRILFQPFDLYRWLVIGFTAWLASLGEWSGGGGGGGGGGIGGRGGGGASPTTIGASAREFWDNARLYVAENLTWLVPAVILATITLVVLGVLILWLSSRGRFMFLHNVALNQADIVAPWSTYQRQGNSLFFFRLSVALIGLLVSLPLLVLLAVSSIAMINSGSLTLGSTLLAIGAGLGLIVLGIAFALVEKLTKDFVVPIMWMRQPSCLAAWKEYGALLRSHLGTFALYILFHILLTLGAGVLILAIVLLTCCIAGCLFALPYLGTVFLLPVLVFFRSYSLLYLAQFGPDYSVFQTPTMPFGSTPAAGA